MPNNIDIKIKILAILKERFPKTTEQCDLIAFEKNLEFVVEALSELKKNGFVTFGDEIISKGRDTKGKLLAAAHIKITPSGIEYLNSVSQKE